MVSPSLTKADPLAVDTAPMMDDRNKNGIFAFIC